MLDPGLQFRDMPSLFFNAKVKINGMLMVGYVLVLENASDWGAYDFDHAKESIILVVCENADAVIKQREVSVPVVEYKIPEKLWNNTCDLISQGGQTLCKGHLIEYSTHLTRHSWFAAMQTEWMENNCARMDRYSEKESMSDFTIVFNTILRGFGFIVNEASMDLLARAIPMKAVTTHIDDIFQLEAIFFGQAGLLTTGPGVQNALPKKFSEKALMEGYFTKLRNEWLYFSKKYDMPMSISQLVWEPYGRGKLIYPHIYLSMLVRWLHKNFRLGILERIISTSTAKEACDLFSTECTSYWESHYCFGAENDKVLKKLPKDRISYLAMFVVAPLQFYIGRKRQEEMYCDRAFDVMEQIPVFKTVETAAFTEYGCNPNDSGESIAMCHLQHAYCNEQKCLKCRFGHNFIRQHH